MALSARVRRWAVGRVARGGLGCRGFERRRAGIDGYRGSGLRGRERRGRGQCDALGVLGEEIAKRGARQLRAHGLAAVCAHRQLFAVMQVLPPDLGLHAAHGLKAGHDQRRIAWLVGGTGNEFDAGPRPAQGRHTGRALDQQGAAA
jgi:hypothetical protein